MNKIVNINLGGFPFTVDEDAYASLKSYLSTLESHFEKSQGYEEIMFDIEARLAELLQDNAQPSSIISRKNLEDSIKIMGTPEDFGAIMDDLDDAPQSSSSQFTSKGKKKRGRRLFRDPDDKVISGVCSGITNYLGFSDPLWVRLVALLLVFGGGISILVYIVLMIIVPEATSSADKLAMKGEPINVDTIAKTVKDEFDEIVERGSDSLSNLGSKKKAVKKPLFRFDQPYPRGFMF